MTKGEFALFRMPETGTHTEDTITTDKIECDGDAEVPDSRCGLISIRPVLDRFKSTQAAPFVDEVTRQDTGFSGIMYEITLFFNEEDGDAAGAIAKLVEWFSERNTVRGKYQHGRIGIRNNYRPEYNLVPNADAGFKVVRFDYFQELKIQYHSRGTVYLEFSGDPKELG